MKRGVFVLAAAGIALLGAVALCPAQTAVLGGADGQATDKLPQQLGWALRQLEQGRAKKADKTVRKWIKAHPDSQSMDQALFIKAQALSARGLYYQAFLAYEKLLDEHSATSLFAPAVRGQVGIARRFLAGEKRKVWGFIATGAKTEALAILDRVVERWPGSEVAAQALVMQADHYYDKGRFLDAQPLYQLLVDDYPRTRYYPQAMLRNAQSTHGQYAGSAYDTSCLAEARVRYDQFRARFPEKITEHRVDECLARIDELQAEKEWQIADFYRRTGKSGAAGWYWNMIIQRWPTSQPAQRASQQLQAQRQGFRRQ